MQSATPGFLARSVFPIALGAMALAVTTSALAAASAQTTGGPLSLQAALERALESNPEILVARARIEAAATRPDQAHSLPDPMLTGVLRNAGFDGITIGEQMMSGAGVRVTQPLPYKGKRDLRSAVAGAGISVSEAQLDLVSRRVVRDVSTGFFELGYLRQAIRVVEDTRGYLVNLEQTAQARYAVGEGIQQDVLKAQVEISVLLNRMIVLEQQSDSVETELNRLLAQPVHTQLGRPEPVPPPTWNLDATKLETEAVRSSALVRERARQVEQRQAGLELSRYDNKPDWVVGGAWLNRGDLPDIWEVNVGLTLPIFSRDGQKRAVEEATAEVRAGRLDHRDSVGVVAAAVREHYLHADRAARLVRLYSEAIVPQATLSLESAIAGYEVGRVDFLTVLDNVVTLLTYRLEFSRQSTDYLQALVAIEEHLGSSLGVTPETIMQRLAPPEGRAGQTPTLTGGAR